MKNLRTLGVFTLIITPIIILGYQNCANLENSSTSKAQTPPPVLFNELSPFEYNYSSPCPDLAPLVMQNKERHLCAVATNQCHLENLMSDNFKEDLDSFCENAIDYRSPDLDETFSTSTAQEEGFTSDPAQVCTFQIQTLVNVKTRTCIEAVNGCQGAYLKQSRGYSLDTPAFCN